MPLSRCAGAHQQSSPDQDRRRSCLLLARCHLVFQVPVVVTNRCGCAHARSRSQVCVASTASSHACPAPAQNPWGPRLGLRPQYLLLERTQLLDTLPLHLCQDVHCLRFRDDFDFELPYTVSQLGVGPLASQLVFCVTLVLLSKSNTTRRPAAHM